MRKYIQPRSLTWWSALIPLASGVVLAASEGIPALQPVGAVLRSIYGEASASVLINAGLAGIGLRAALGR